MVYFCAFGPDCERVHDLFDEVLIEIETSDHDTDVVMTTWHSHESLTDALEFFALSALPADGYLEGSEFWIGVSISNQDWRREIEQQLSALLP